MASLKFGIMFFRNAVFRNTVAFTARNFQLDCRQMKYKTAVVRRMERKKKRKLYEIRKKTQKTAKVNATNIVTGINFAEDEEIGDLSRKLALTELARSQIKQSSPIINPGSVYQQRPDLQQTVIGEDLKSRLIWKEKDWPNGFPDSPEEANTDLTTYLIQKDIYRRRQVIEIPKFCVGSIVAITRAEPYSPKGSLRFVGLCIERRAPENLLYASFTLRNVIDNEPVEINFQLYSPFIQKVEVLKHERRTNRNGKEDLTFLRDHPLEDSKVDENMEALPYTEEPMEYRPKPGELKRLYLWFRSRFRLKSPRWKHQLNK